MVMPGEMDDTYIVVVRERYAALAENVLANITAFLKFHLRELTHQSFMKVLAKWMATDEAVYNKKANIAWSPDELRSNCMNPPSSLGGVVVEDALDFVLRVGDDPMITMEGTLHIDPNMASVKDIDDGLTVIGFMDDWKAQHNDLTHAIQQITIVTTDNTRLTSENERHLARLAQLEAATAGSGGKSAEANDSASDAADSAAGDGAMVNSQGTTEPSPLVTEGRGSASTSGPC